MESLLESKLEKEKQSLKSLKHERGEAYFFRVLNQRHLLCRGWESKSISIILLFAKIARSRLQNSSSASQSGELGHPWFVSLEMEAREHR
uniref:Uncharacterized protein n=1 Tax=Nelumbo nucifera TaxID=4432 RepID=A0A822ZBL4_NELNU|nr:TPA_asm: hypothetical protein HUJ06_015158 [Nelumbo nucifera]